MTIPRWVENIHIEANKLQRCGIRVQYEGCRGREIEEEEKKKKKRSTKAAEGERLIQLIRVATVLLNQAHQCRHHLVKDIELGACPPRCSNRCPNRWPFMAFYGRTAADPHVGIEVSFFPILPPRVGNEHVEGRSLGDFD